MCEHWPLQEEPVDAEAKRLGFVPPTGPATDGFLGFLNRNDWAVVLLGILFWVVVVGIVVLCNLNW